MELRHLRYFVAVAEELHFGRAAERLNISQPPLSTQVSQLERQIGVRLLERSTRKVTLTPAGLLFQRRAVALLADLDDAAQEAREADAGLRGRLRIGFVSSTNFTVLPPAVRRFRHARPQVELQLRPLASAEQIDSLHAGALDIGLIRLPALANGLHLETVLTESMVAAVPDDHAFTALDAVTADQLVAEPIVLFPYRLMPGFVGQVMEMFAATGRSPRIVQQAIHHETAIGLVAAGVGISILPESATRLHAGGIRLLPIVSSPRSELAIATPSDQSLVTVAPFVSCLHDAAKHLAED
ncbi:MAG: LysR family transcriptional regulator [Nocardioidaceae bacterium]